MEVGIWAENNMKIKTVMLFLVSSQFHLDAAIIYNQYLRALRYNLYGNILTDERYNTKAMKMIRRGVIEAAGIPNSSYSELCLKPGPKGQSRSAGSCSRYAILEW